MIKINKRSISFLSSILLTSFSVSAMASDSLSVSGVSTESISKKQQKTDFSMEKRTAALQIAQQYQQLKPMLNQLSSADKSLSLNSLSKNKQLDLTEFNTLERTVITGKGYADYTTDLVEIRLADNSMLEALEAGVEPLFAFEPAGDESQWQFIEAFDSQGQTHLLEVDQLPERPVIVVDINAKADIKAGMELMQSVFDEHRKTISSKSSSKKSAKTNGVSSGVLTLESAVTEVLQTTVMEKISLKDDEEPWISGAAEVYAVVNGVSAEDISEANLDVVGMPYLDYDNTTYYPNQVVILWDRYRWGAADMILMEQDDNTNYKDLALALLNAATEILKLIPEASSYAVIPQITSGIISAMPDEWFSNDDDYVDVFYTILKDQTYTNRYGASANAQITLKPLNIN